MRRVDWITRFSVSAVVFAGLVVGFAAMRG